MTASAGACPGCGAPIVEGDRFCRGCGYALAGPTPPIALSPAPGSTLETPGPPTVPPPEASTDWTKPVGGPGYAPTAPEAPTDWTKPVGDPAAAPPAPQAPVDWTQPVGGPPIEPPVPMPTTDWTVPVGTPARARSSAGRGGTIGRGLRSLGRGAVGCLTVFFAIGLVGAVLSSLEGAGSTPSPSRTGATWTPAWEPPVETPAGRETPQGPPLQVGLRDAIDTGLVKMAADGINLQELRLTLESLTDEPLSVNVAPGTIFKPGASATQSMVVITDSSIYLDAGDVVDFILDVACASMTKDTPGSSEHFTLRDTPASSDLRKLVATDGFAAADFRVQQFAIWTITNNPTRSGYVGLGTLGVGSGPSSAEIREIKALFREAGIDASKYRALR